MEPIDIELEEGELELPSEPMHLNMGPSHPAMHGTVRIVLELSGETIVKADVQIGYLHRGFEKMCERGSWSQIFPYVDRLNYVSPMLNNVGFALAVEKMLGVTVPERCQYYRVVLGELARMSDHLTCSGAMMMELGAFTPFLYWIRARDAVWEIFEEETGARLTHSFGRVGGMAKPPSADFKEMVRAGVPRVLALLDDLEHALQHRADVVLEVGRRRLRHAADAAEAVGDAGAGLLLEDVPDHLAGAGHVEEGGEGAELHGHGAIADEVVADAGELAEHHAVVLAALGHADAQHLLHGQREADVVEHRRDVVEPVGVREDLAPGPALAHLLEAAVQVADLHVRLDDALARQLEHDAHRAVHGRVRRAEVDLHVSGREVVGNVRHGAL